MKYLRRNTIELYSDFREQTPVDPHKKIVTRESRSIDKIVLHCTDASHWTPQRLAEFAIAERGFSICSYHFYVMDTVVYHMVGNTVITPHAGIWNKHSLAIAIDFYPTRYERNNIRVDPNVFKNAVETAGYLCIKHGISPTKDSLVGHRELMWTGFFRDKQDNIVLRKTCPGMTIDLDVFRHLVVKNVQRRLNEILGTQLTIDGIFGPKTKAVLRTGYYDA